MSKERLWPLVGAAMAAVVLMVAAALFTNATVATRITENADRLHWANATLGTSALTRAAAGQVSLIDAIAASRAIPEEATQTANEELDKTRASLQRLVSDAPYPIDESLAGFVAITGERPVDIDAIDEAYWPAATWLESRQAEARLAIANNDNSAGRLSAVMRLVITLIVPGAAIWFYRRRVKAAEARMEAELQIARAKDEFVAGMSHEIRTPLTGIFGFSEVLLEGPPSAEMDREIIGVINTEAAELSRMVDDFIVAARLEETGVEVELSPTDMTQLATTIAARFARRGVPIEIHGSGSALADKGRTSQVLTNLISNAVRHGGDTVAIAIKESEASVSCAIVDNGEGVPPEMMERLFSRFAHRSRDVLITGSLGLGSWVARDLARAMGGDVTYERRPGQTRFTLTLPKAPPPEDGAHIEIVPDQLAVAP